MYQNGFICEDGPFREYDTEENKKFMETLNKGYVPEELPTGYCFPNADLISSQDMGCDWDL